MRYWWFNSFQLFMLQYEYNISFNQAYILTQVFNYYFIDDLIYNINIRPKYIIIKNINKRSKNNELNFLNDCWWILTNTKFYVFKLDINKTIKNNYIKKLWVYKSRYYIDGPWYTQSHE